MVANRKGNFAATRITRCITAGLSVKWEGETFVVDTKGFNEKFWMSNGGLPHTDQLHLH
jgi:hypothetical protein